MDHARSMRSMIIEEFFRHKLAVVGLVVIVSLTILALSADLISDWTGIDPNSQNVSARYLEPFTYAEEAADQRENKITEWIKDNPENAKKISAAIVEKQLLNVTVDDALYELVSKNPEEIQKLLKQIDLPEKKSLQTLSKTFSTFHLFGTDEIGRDVAIRLLYGTRVSMGVGVLVALVSALIGFLIGGIAGFYQGIIDTLLMRVTDALLSLPIVPVLIVFAAIDLTKLPGLKSLISGEFESVFKMVILLCLFSWMPVARLVRGSILTLREREFVLAARTLGAKDSTIIFRHLLPNVIATLLVSVTLGVGESILFEAALSFLGLGIMPPTASWGNMLNNAQEVIYKSVWIAILPGLLIWITVVSFNFIGDGLQEAMDPKSVKR